MSKKLNMVTGKVDAMEWVSKNGYPVVGTFVEEKVLQKFYKQLDTAMLEDWCAKEGLEYKACPDSEPIHRMRVAMSILYKHFPKESKGSTKAKSKYADYTTESLIAMAVDKDIAVEVTDDMRIMRMRVIMALRAHKVID